MSVATAQILEDQAALGTLLHEEAGLSAQPLATALKLIANWRTRLKAEGAGIATAAVIDRVELGLGCLLCCLREASGESNFA